MAKRMNVRKIVGRGGHVSWEARYRDPMGKQRQRTFATKEAAERFQAERRAAVLSGRAADEDKGARTFAHYAAKWVAQKEASAIRPVTMRGYQRNLNRHVLPWFGSLAISRITPSTVDEWIAHMRQKQVAGHALSPRTIRAAFIPLNQVLALAVRDGGLIGNPATGAPLPANQGPVDSAGRSFIAAPLSESEAVALCEQLAKDDPTGLHCLVVQFLLGTGLRAAEFAGLEIRDYNPLRRTISIERTKTYRASPTPTNPRPGPAWETGLPKSKRSTRIIPISQELAQDLDAYLQTHPKRHDPTAPLFVASAVANGPLDPGPFRDRVLRPAAVKVGLPPGVRLHDLRHTYGTTLIEHNVPAEKVSRLMGHGSISITMDLYVHPNTAMHHDAVEALPSYRTQAYSKPTNGQAPPQSSTA